MLVVSWLVFPNKFSILTSLDNIITPIYTENKKEDKDLRCLLKYLRISRVGEDKYIEMILLDNEAIKLFINSWFAQGYWRE